MFGGTLITVVFLFVYVALVLGGVGGAGGAGF